MIYTAILVACLATTPSPIASAPPPPDCRRHEMLIEGGANPMSAFLEAQTRAAQWLAQHPGLVKRSLRVVAGRAV